MLSPTISMRVGPGELKGKVEVTADDLKMKNLEYAGQTKDGGRYDVRAKEAAVDFAQTGPVKLDHIDGTITQVSGIVTKLKARRGFLDNKKGEMDLFDGVEIDASNGMKARLKSAKVFNKDHRVVSKEPVVMDMPTGRIEANAMDFETKARKGTFQGDVKVRMAQAEQAGRQALGLGRDAKGPLDVRSARLDIDDGAKHATFSGGVTAAQGDSVIQASDLKVFYEGSSALPGQPAAAASGPNEASRVARLHAAGSVIVTAGPDRRILSEAVEFDVKGDTALFTGPNVEVTQGRNRLLGRRLAINRKTGKSRLDAPAEGRQPAGRIQTTFYQSDAKAGTAVKLGKAAPAAEQGGGMMNFKTDPNAPMDIQAETLDVTDAQKQAVYRGAVRAQQGDFVIQTNELVATYTGDTGLMATTDTAQVKGAGAQISKVEAKNKVVITSRAGEEASGEWATFDVARNTVVMGGGVKLKQDRRELSGSRLYINTLTGEVKVENEPGGAQVGAALAPIVAPKSAAAPGGLPAIQPAEAAPKAPAACPPGRQCLQIFPEDEKKAAKERVKPKSEGWLPQTSPSAVYKAP